MMQASNNIGLMAKAPTQGRAFDGVETKRQRDWVA